MTTSSLSSVIVLDDPRAREDAMPAEEREHELRALRALSILLESRLIDQLEFDRRLASIRGE